MAKKKGELDAIVARAPGQSSFLRRIMPLSKDQCRYDGGPDIAILLAIFRSPSSDLNGNAKLRITQAGNFLYAMGKSLS